MFLMPEWAGPTLVRVHLYLFCTCLYLAKNCFNTELTLLGDMSFLCRTLSRSKLRLQKTSKCRVKVAHATLTLLLSFSSAPIHPLNTHTFILQTPQLQSSSLPFTAHSLSPTGFHLTVLENKKEQVAYTLFKQWLIIHVDYWHYKIQGVPAPGIYSHT